MSCGIYIAQKVFTTVATFTFVFTPNCVPQFSQPLHRCTNFRILLLQDTTYRNDLLKENS